MLATFKSYKAWRNIALTFILAAAFLNTTQSREQFMRVANVAGGKSEIARPKTSGGFGEKLAEAALERTNHFVIYNPTYMKISYPGGDVPSFFGVCTDVVVRAYRTLGVDLQKLVHQSLGGDKNIAHRRVRDLKRFFARRGRSLKVTKSAADYKAGDIVTYYIPGGWSSKDHIAVVSSRRTLTGRPYIIHNMGFGPQSTDDLFSWKITGHYRYQPR